MHKKKKKKKKTKKKEGRKEGRKAANQSRIKPVRLFGVEEIQLRAN